MKPNVDQVRPSGYNSNKLDRGALDNVSSQYVILIKEEEFYTDNENL
jgi:hypothetical protein